MTINELDPDEYNSYYHSYIKRVGGQNVIDALRYNHESVIPFFNDIRRKKLCYRYSEEKWTIKEILQHLIDTERVFAYRALRIARHDRTNLPGFDQDAFVMNSHANGRTIHDLLSEYQSVRMATISLFDSFDQKILKKEGIVNESVLSVRAIAYIVVGHEAHHVQLIKDRYL